MNKQLFQNLKAAIRSRKLQNFFWECNTFRFNLARSVRIFLYRRTLFSPFFLVFPYSIHGQIPLIEHGPEPTYTRYSLALFSGDHMKEDLRQHKKLYISLFLLAICGPVYYGPP